MAIQPVDFIDLARSMLEPNSPEPVLRTVIGRYYYGAFLLARERAGLHSQSPGIHKDVIAHFKRNPATKVIGNQLDNIFKIRKTADYDLDVNISYKEASSVGQRAVRIFEGLHNVRR